MRLTLLGVTLVGMLCGGCATSIRVADDSVPRIETAPLAIKSDHAKLDVTGPNRFQVKCDGIQAVAVKQKEPTWCWAACAEMIHHYAGTPVTQEQVVESVGLRTKAGEEPQTAEKLEIWLALNPDVRAEMQRREAAWRAQQKATVNVRAEVDASNATTVINMLSNPSSDVIVQELSQGNPLVLGLKGEAGEPGHLVLVYGVEYSRLNPDGEVPYRDLTLVLFRFDHRFAIHKILIVDPQPDEKHPQYAELTGQQLASLADFAIGKADARKQLEAYMKVFMPTPAQMAGGKPVFK